MKAERIVITFLILLAGAAILVVLSGCTLVGENRVFPKLAWYWSDDAKEQRADTREQHQR